jgi:hypothetical protein
MLAIKKTGGEAVASGYYWNFSNGERVHFSERGVLPGRADETYHMVPPAAVLVAGPVLGLAYAVFLPFIGIAMLLSLAARKLFGGLLQSAYRGAAFSWKPSEAYLVGKKGRSRKTISKKDEEKKE